MSTMRTSCSTLSGVKSIARVKNATVSRFDRNLARTPFATSRARIVVSASRDAAEQSEDVLRSCLDAVASGDAEELERCLLECDEALEATGKGVSSTEVVSELRKRPEVNTDEFWREKLKELSAERVFEDCMTAVMRGDVDEVEACIFDAENDELLK
ncbi:unnamed product [Ostreococcus tauri]|uniref:Unnamed product n=2 Tax=Ostreococcus tauri TaxID=70448 RepID=A0A096PA64_OSTTA|nr:unnamed product [Ostreococcus tauri]CEG00827.1 unnamed product [Ostreococcus tauri]|eukprot:XP_003084403.2 unnamed product [Ostreococcus tauri]